MLFKNLASAATLFAMAAFAAPALNSREGTCTFTIGCSNSEGGGGPGQAPLDNTACDESIYANGKLLWGSNGGNDLDLTHTIPASTWKGAGDIQIVSGWNGGDNALTECKYTVQGQTHEAKIQNSLSSGIVSVSKSTCQWTLPCNA